MSFAEDWGRRLQPGAGPLGILPLAMGQGLPDTDEPGPGAQGILPYAMAANESPATQDGDAAPSATDAGADTAAAAGPAPARNAAAPGAAPRPARSLLERDRRYLANYYSAMARLAQQYGVNPALALGVGGESNFASGGTYTHTGDAFGMTGGGVGRLTHAANAAQNAQQFFDAYGDQIRGSGGDVDRFINGLQGRDAQGQPVKNWKRYNSAKGDYEKRLHKWIGQMQRDIPLYQPDPPAPPR